MTKVPAKQRLIQALEFPAWLILQELDVEVCTHSGYYNSSDWLCRRCQFAEECRWLKSAEDLDHLQTKSEADLAQLLSYAVDYVTCLTDQMKHGHNTCDCEACRWLRKARVLKNRMI